MKTLITLFTLLTTFSSFANYKGLYCNTDPEKGTTYALRKNQNGFEFFVNHLGGEGIIPIQSSGEVYIGSLNWLLKKAEIMKKLGEQYSVNFAASDCEFTQDLKYGVCKIKDVTVSNIEFAEIAFYYALGKKVTNDRYDVGDISMVYKIRNSSDLFDGENGSDFIHHQIAIDLKFQESCVFRGF